MAWPDGSRFLVANGVKWGTGPKFYPGPSVDTPWNHDLNWKNYCKHESEQDFKAAERTMVLTPAKPNSINQLIRPGIPVYRPKTSGSVASARSPKALSEAGKRLLASRMSSRGGSEWRGASSRSRRSRMTARSGSAARLTPQTKKELADLKDTLKRQAEAQAMTDARMAELAAAVASLRDTVVREAPASK